MTSIRFNLVKAGKATLTIRDVAGKVIETLKREYDAGWNVVNFKKKDMKTTGILFYTLESDSFISTKKMIVLE